MEHIEVSKWDDLNLRDDVLRGIYAYGFEDPSDIQKKAIYPMISGKDLIAQAQSGSGKTGTFTISTLQLIDATKQTTQALVLVPTHELAKQIASVFVSIGSFVEGLNVKTLVGGTSVRDDIKDLEECTPHIIVGCLGRVVEMFRKGFVNPSDIKLLVIDEADEMLSREFGSQVRDMFRHFFNDNIQVTLFSATIPAEILTLSEKFMRNPTRIMVKAEELSLKCIQQFYVALNNDSAKYDALKDLFSVISVSKCIIYCNNVSRVIDLFEAMKRDGFSTCHIHSAMDKETRLEGFNQFCSGDARVLISSDVTARGIDIQQVSTVINFDVPLNVHTYLHRIGRGGRWGRKGFAINFVTKQDVRSIQTIESHYGIQINELPSTFCGKV
ncbi:briggsae CBR-INF-1 protein [Ochromonadaceae sp. CCMP2298]|nr:briggsae CBR-INF-1 protein [Ochromonadaceae sp. CCMP2298]